MTEPYWSDETCSLYLGDMREVLPAPGVTADLIVADPPYGETSLAWDRWPDGWLDVAATVARSLWCFGSLRMYLERADEFKTARWKLSQDIIWEKHNGSGFARDRFKRVHEQPTHWYRGEWGSLHHETPRIPSADPSDHRQRRRKPNGTPHAGQIGGMTFREDGTRLARSVIYARSMKGHAIHPTEKPVMLLLPLITYACPPGGLIIDPFAGSGSTLDAARQSGRRAIGIERHEPYAERAALRLSQMTLEVA